MIATPRRRRSRRLAVPAALLAAALATMPLAAQWSQWRGPHGSGVAAGAEPLPTSWEPGDGSFVWSTPLPGEGVSSPIVDDGRVFVTAAREGGGLSWPLLATAAGLALLFALAVRGARSPAGGRLLPALSYLFLVLAIAIVARPELFYSAGNPGRVWRTTGAVGLIGLAVACGWLRPASRWRLAGAGLLAAATLFFIYHMPSSQLGAVALEKRLLFALPGLVGAAVYLWRYLRPRRPATPATPNRAPAWAAVPLAALAAMVFLPPNYWQALERVVLALDFESGEILWERRVFKAPREQKWERGSYATPTPATDGERVYAYFGAGVAALDVDGRLLWSQRFPGYSRHTRYGAASSPVLVGDLVVIVQESEMYQDAPPGWMAAFDKRSGELAWRISPAEAHDSYATPQVVGPQTAPRLIAASWHHLAAYDAGTGERLWLATNTLEQVVASMARDGDLLAVTGGVIGDRALLVYRLAGGVSPPELLWQTSRRVATISSPVFFDGMLFTLTDAGVLSCYRAESGEELWKARLEGEHFASLVAGDGKVYAVSAAGAVSVIAAAPEYRLLAVNRLDGPVMSSPALATGSLLVRTTTGLHRIAATGA